jgi:3-methylfumaryl-CoA hydratase
MTDIDLDALRPWLERRESVDETLSPVPALSLAATLDLPAARQPDATLPPLWQWLHFLDRSPSAQLGPDGSPRTRALLPPIDLPQIMWAGAELECLGPLRLGEPARKVSRIADMTAKHGSRGPMVFLTHEHRVEQGGATVLIERTRAVFLGAAKPAAGGVAPPDRVAERERVWPVDEALLFRFSALTFNTHRIHYDLPYATQVGGYPGLVVHGPLQAILLAETFREWFPQARVRRIAFRAQAPLYCGAPVVVGGAAHGPGEYAVWTRAAAGGAAMTGVVSFEAGL